MTNLPPDDSLPAAGAADQPAPQRFSRFNLISWLLIFTAGYYVYISLFAGDAAVSTQLDLGAPVAGPAAPMPLHKAPPLLDARLDTAKPAGDATPRVRVLKFWAPWCPRCVVETQDFEKFAASLPDGAEAVVVATDYSSLNEIRDKLASKSFQVVLDPDGKVAGDWNVRVLPTSFLIDARGVVRRRIVSSYEWTGPEIKADIEKLVKMGE